MTAEAEQVAQDLRPRPLPNESNRFYWEAAREHRLVLQRCDACHQFQYPPDVVCVHCQSLAMTPTAVSGKGVLYSFATVDRAFHPGFSDQLPYVVALVDLDEQPHLRMLTNIVECSASDLFVGMPLEVTFEDRETITMPQFRPQSGPA
ncbi:MAG: hypothetical protein JWL70_1157 [Acidimicrobiia bacterium]|nr:hypothetical protein [Acidimicrobiia bacterium]